MDSFCFHVALVRGSESFRTRIFDTVIFELVPMRRMDFGCAHASIRFENGAADGSLGLLRSKVRAPNGPPMNDL